MIAENRKRRYKIVAIAMGCACVLTVTVLNVLLGLTTEPIMLLYCLLSMFAAGVAVDICWRAMQSKGESKSRGALFGALAGFLSLILMSMFASILGNIMMLFSTHIGFTKFIELFFTNMFFTALYSFIFGGFLAIPIGAIAGFLLAKDPEKN